MTAVRGAVESRDRQTECVAEFIRRQGAQAKRKLCERCDAVEIRIVRPCLRSGKALNGAPRCIRFVASERRETDAVEIYGEVACVSIISREPPDAARAG